MKRRHVAALAGAALVALSAAGCQKPASPPDAYVDGEGVVHIAYTTIDHVQGRHGGWRAVPLPDAYARAQETLGAEFAVLQQPLAELMPFQMVLRTAVPESAYVFGHFPTATIEYIVDPVLDADSRLVRPDPGDGGFPEDWCPITLEVQHPVPELRVDTTTRLETAAIPEIRVTHRTSNDGRTNHDWRYEWLDGQVRYKIELSGAGFGACLERFSREQVLGMIESMAPP